MSFLPSKKAGGTIIGFSTGAALLPATTPFLAKASSYSTSKLALSRFYEFLAAENPDLNVFVIHPGVVETAMYVKSQMEQIGLEASDKSELLETPQIMLMLINI